MEAVNHKKRLDFLLYHMFLNISPCPKFFFFRLSVFLPLLPLFPEIPFSSFRINVSPLFGAMLHLCCTLGYIVPRASVRRGAVPRTSSAGQILPSTQVCHSQTSMESKHAGWSDDRHWLTRLDGVGLVGVRTTPVPYMLNNCPTLYMCFDYIPMETKNSTLYRVKWCKKKHGPAPLISSPVRRISTC